MDMDEQANETPQAVEAWKEVGRRFEELGQSLARTVHVAWQNEEVRDQAEEMKSGLESMVRRVGAAIKETAESESLKATAGETARSVQDAGEQTVEEVRPHLVEALQELDRQLKSLIREIESGGEAEEERS